MVHCHCEKMREYSYQSGTWAQKSCAILGVHAKIWVQLGSKTGHLTAFFSGFGELRPIESSGLTGGLVVSNPISYPKITRVPVSGADTQAIERTGHMGYTLGPLAILHKQ